MRRTVPAVAAACLLVGPTVLAFFSGGYFTQPRLVAGIAAWALVFAVCLVGPSPLPRSLPGWLTLGGLSLITAWSALSILWTPTQGAAVQNVQRLLLYVGALLLAVGVLRSPRALRAVEPALAAGATVVIGYGLAGRLLPGIVELSVSKSAGGRLEQPITYWNAEGALAAVGLVLCARLAGDRTRALAVRSLAAAAAVPLGAGVYLSYSRGAIACAALGLVILVATAPSRSQLYAAVVVLVGGVGASVPSSAYQGVAKLGGPLDIREREGAIVLAIMLMLAAGAALLTVWRVLSERRGAARDDRLPGSRWMGPLAGALVGLVVVGLIVGGLQEKRSGGDLELEGGRLTSVSSNRYEYWRVGLRAFGRDPVKGLGSGGFRVFWLRERPILEAVRDTHSLEVEMAAELGVVGLLAFGLMIGGLALAARRALQRHPTLASGACSGALVWLLHASLDWDWQMPAVTLPAIVLFAVLLVLAEAPAAPSARPRGDAQQPDTVPALV